MAALSRPTKENFDFIFVFQCDFHLIKLITNQIFHAYL